MKKALGVGNHKDNHANKRCTLMRSKMEELLHSAVRHMDEGKEILSYLNRFTASKACLLYTSPSPRD